MVSFNYNVMMTGSVLSQLFFSPHGLQHIGNMSSLGFTTDPLYSFSLVLEITALNFI